MATPEEIRDELLDSFSGEQLRVIQLMVSTIAQAWNVMQGTFTPRQKELLLLIGEDRKMSETINDIERLAKR